MKKKSKVLNEIRSDVLEDLKTGFTRLPKEIVKGVEKTDRAEKKEVLENLEKVVLELYDLKLTAVNDDCKDPK